MLSVICDIERTMDIRTYFAILAAVVLLLFLLSRVLKLIKRRKVLPDAPPHIKELSPTQIAYLLGTDYRRLVTVA